STNASIQAMRPGRITRHPLSRWAPPYGVWPETCHARPSRQHACALLIPCRSGERRNQVKITLKPLREQTIVITGASSGIGRATAREAARRGARLVLASRNREALESLVDELKSQGAEAVAVVADVGVLEDHQKILQTAMLSFGGFETWVNNAGVDRK